MRKIALFLVIILVVSAPLSVSATPRALTIDPVLAFNGNTAVCETMAVGNDMSEYIHVTMTLKQGSKTIRTWSSEGYGYVYMLKETLVLKGYTYTLVVAVTVNGTAYTPVSINATN